MRQLMLTKAGDPPESLPTLVTLKRFLGSMQPLMCNQAGAIRGSWELKFLPSVHPLVLS